MNNYDCQVIADETLKCIKKIMENSQFTTISDMIQKINYAKKLVKSCKEVVNKKLRFISKNIVKKVQLIVLEQSEELGIEINEDSIYVHINLDYRTVLNMKKKAQTGWDQQIELIRQQVLDQIEMLIIEVQDSLVDLMKQSSRLINNNEIILITDYSELVIEYLIKLHKEDNETSFEIIMVENPIEKQVTKQSLSKLQQHGIQCVIIPETSIFVVMNRVNKVLIDAFGIMNSGGIISIANGLLIATAANNFQIPVLVFSQSYKLSDKFPLDQQTFNQQVNPNKLMNLDRQHVLQNNENLKILADMFNYIQPNQISLFITNMGQYTPQHIYRLFQDYFGKEEYLGILENIKTE